jgi:hypothetical protein
VTMKQTRAALTWFLLAAAALLSFDALTHRAAQAHLFAEPLFLGAISVHMLDQVWAVVIDVLAATGVLGLKLDRRDPRAWAALGLGLGLSLTFQAFVFDTWQQRLMAAVPALALSMAVWIFEVPWGERRQPTRAEPWPVGERGLAMHADSTLITPPTPEPTPPTPPVASVAPVAWKPLTDAGRERLRRAHTANRDPAPIVAELGVDPEVARGLTARWDRKREQQRELAATNGHRTEGP